MSVKFGGEGSGIRYKTAIIGAGAIADYHLAALREMTELQPVAIADIHDERARQAAAEYGIVPYTDYKIMAEIERPDIVVITLPHFLHMEAALWCMQNGCHVLLEKPMALDGKQCDAIIGAARDNGVALMIGHTQHYMGHNLLAKRIIREERLGKLIMINDRRHVDYFSDERPAWFFRRKQAGGGIFMNLGSHSVDKVQWLTDSPITLVKASISHEGKRGDIEGSGTAFAVTASGIPVTIAQSGYGGVPVNETELIFTNGMMKLSTGSGLWLSDNGQYVPAETESEPKEAPFVRQFRDLLADIESGNPTADSGEYGKSVVAVVEAMYRSAATGCEVRL